MLRVPPSKTLERALLSRRLSLPSKHWITVIRKTRLDRGRRAYSRCPETSARESATWRYNSAFGAARTSAHQLGSGASADSQSLGIQEAFFVKIEKQSSYFPSSIALRKKIISSSRIPFTRSTDHVDNNKHPKDTPLLAGHLGGLRRRDLHRACRRGHLPARPLVIHVARDHRRRTTPLVAAPLHRPAAWPRSAFCDRLLRQADRADDQWLRQGASPRAAEHRVRTLGDRDRPDHRQHDRRAEDLS